MLLNLHVKNLALIETVDIEFADGLNILTGETGAGKSIIIGSINIALGQKVPKDIIRKGADFAYIELVFLIGDEEKRQLLKLLDIHLAEDNLLIISRKITNGRSISKINDETVTISKLRSVTDLLIDVHGQHEHQSLLYKTKHLEILDFYIYSQTKTALNRQLKELYEQYKQLEHRLEEFSMDEESRRREADFYRFEIDEIEQAQLKAGEEEALVSQYRYFSNARKITAALSAAHRALDFDGVSAALKEINHVAEYDSRLVSVKNQLYDAESIVADVSRDISNYLESMDVDEGHCQQIESRLDLIRNVQAKYGGNVETVLSQLDEKKQKLAEMENYEQISAKILQEFSYTRDKLEDICQQLSEVRKKYAAELTAKITEKLKDLNFIDVHYEMEFSRLDHYTPTGVDEAEFMISTNPGESPKTLSAVASGGELSRIMLAIKTVLAEADQIDTLIFDEVDTGISGRTAQRVSEQLAFLSRLHQVICITHLPQIAAMADRHFEIAKKAERNQTTTTIHPLNQEQMIEELARLLGGAEITPAVLKNAEEMKVLAESTKNEI